MATSTGDGGMRGAGNQSAQDPPAGIDKDSLTVVEALLADFWAWRSTGRKYQTLQYDLELYLTQLQYFVDWQVCGTIYRQAMAAQDWDLRQGGKAPSGRPWWEFPVPSSGVVLPPRKKWRKSGQDGKGGLIAY